jgi:hypothetical protein
MVSTTLESSIGDSEEPPERDPKDPTPREPRRPDPAERPGAAASGAGAGAGLWDIARWTAAVAMVGAGIIHFAYAPVHLDEELSHGLFFLVTGWLQLMLAVALVTRIRPRQLWLAATALVNLGIVAVWVVSRTAGVPGAEVESVGFPDVTASVLEAVAVLASFAVLSGLLADRAVQGRAGSALVGVGALATVALVSMAVSPSFAGEHSHGAGGHSDGGDAAAADGHGHAAGGPSAEEWADIRYAALSGNASPEFIDEFEAAEAEYLGGQIRDRSQLLRTLPPDEADARVTAYTDWAIANTMDLLDGAQTNGAGMHSHGAVAWQPLTDPADRIALQDQLEEAGAVIDQFPDIAAAEAAGYRQISPYVPGIGAHWINGNFDDKFEAGKPEMLLFNGTDPDSELVGLSYATVGPEAPEGFVGPNDSWHAHPGLCMLGGLVVGIDGTPKELCESIGGEIAAGLANLHMAHLWQVPGWESEWGLFSAENPQLNVVTWDIGRDIAARDGANA